MGMLKYAVVGGICTVFDILVFMTLLEVFGLHYLISSTVSFSLAVFLNYYLCVKHLFQTGARFGKRGELFYFFVISAVGLLIHQGVLICFVGLFGLEALVSKVFATATVFTWNYMGRKCFVFNSAGAAIRKF